jgi:hypothetical protein
MVAFTPMSADIDLSVDSLDVLFQEFFPKVGFRTSFRFAARVAAKLVTFLMGNEMAVVSGEAGEWTFLDRSNTARFFTEVESILRFRPGTCTCSGTCGRRRQPGMLDVTGL